MTQPRDREESLPALPRWTPDALAAIADRYPDWAGRFSGDEPVYRLSKEAIAALALPRGSQRAGLLSEAEAAAENEFTRACAGCRWLGLQGGEPIWCHVVDYVPLALPDEESRRALGWSERELADIAVVGADAGRINDRLLGALGWLLTEPACLAELDELRALYVALPARLRPEFPLERVLRVADADGSDPAVVPAFARFSAGLSRFFDRWAVQALPAWDLPVPRGPRLPDPLPAGHTARETAGVVLYLPVHYRVRGDEALLARIERAQRAQAEAFGVPAGYAALGHHDTYARMFRVLHLERSIRRRFPAPPRGLIAGIEAAAADDLGLSLERVRRLRKLIAACRAGRRDQVRELRVRD